MLKEMEVLTADAVTGWLKRARKPHPPPPIGTACRNCGHVLTGRYCADCGQSSDQHHRSILHLFWEAIESLLHADARLWRTLPALFFRPGTLGKDYLEGRLARHVPPFRMFLVALLIYMFSAEHLIGEVRHAVEHAQAQAAANPAAARAQAAGLARAGAERRYQRELRQAEKDRKEALADADERAGAQRGYERAVAEANSEHAEALAKADLIAQGKAKSEINGLFGDEAARRSWAEKARQKADPSKGPFKEGLRRGFIAAMENPDYYLTVMFNWGHRLAVLLLPITAAYLGVLYCYKRRFYVYDHLIIAMDFLSFQFLGYAIGFLLPPAVRTPWMWVLVFWTPVNLFMALRGAYGSSIAGAVVKSVLLTVATAVTFLILVLAVSIVALLQL